MHRRTRTTLTTLLLLIWQASAGYLLGTSNVHAHATGVTAAQVAVESAAVEQSGAPEADAPCHGQAEADRANQPSPPSDEPDCCKSDDCAGACVVNPALPASLEVQPVPPPVASAAPGMRLAQVPVFSAEFFRPPI